MSNAPGVVARFGIDEMIGVAADIDAALDRLELRHDPHCVMAALQLAAPRRLAQHQVDMPLADALVDVAQRAFERGGGMVAGRRQ